MYLTYVDGNFSRPLRVWQTVLLGEEMVSCKRKRRFWENLPGRKYGIARGYDHADYKEQQDAV